MRLTPRGEAAVALLAASVIAALWLWVFIAATAPR